MNKTYYTGDTVVVNKIPGAVARLGGADFIPPRGSVVIARTVFGNVASKAERDEGYIIKRVIGLPGDTLTIRDGVLTIFNAKYPDGFQPDIGAKWAKTYIPNNKDELFTITIGRGEVFLIGDNRPTSLDSRVNGPLRAEHIEGLVMGQL